MGLGKETSGLKDKRFGPYTVLERIGVGGMATVHLATESGSSGSERVVALKRLLPHLAADDEFIESFVREAQLSSLLHHDNIAEVYELGKVGECYFIAMEYIHGRDLRSCLKQAQKTGAPPPLDFTVFLMIELCSALEYAHTKADTKGKPLGLVHRDISPANLLISADGHIKIIDFGIAKATEAHEATRSGAIKGKLSYLPPETLTGQLDARSDLFSVGVVAHELLTATPLFADSNDFKVLNNIQHMEPVAPSSVNKNCPPALDAVVLKALAKDPNERWQSASDFRGALSQVAKECNFNLSTRTVTSWVDSAFSSAAGKKTVPEENERRGREIADREDLFSTGKFADTHESLLLNEKDILAEEEEFPTEIEFSLSGIQIDGDDDDDDMETIAAQPRSSSPQLSSASSVDPEPDTAPMTKPVSGGQRKEASESLVLALMNSLGNSSPPPAVAIPKVTFAERTAPFVTSQPTRSSTPTLSPADTSPISTLSSPRRKAMTIAAIVFAGVAVFFVLLSLFG